MSSMIHICAEANKTNTVTKEFKNRNLSTLTIGRLSQIQIFSKPLSQQLAYSGYKGNIEAFVFATAIKQKVFTGLERYVLPDSYVPTVPLPLPQIVVKMGAKLTPEQMIKITSRLAAEVFEKIEIGAGGPAYEILKPSWTTVFQLLPKIANRNCARMDQRGQVADILLLKPIYQFIDLFLATNTYPYKKSDFEAREAALEIGLGARLETRLHDTRWRHGFGAKTTTKKVKWGDEAGPSKKISEEEPEDLTPYSDTITSTPTVVHVAKPSPLPSSTSWGSPSSVPNVGGLIFPYFAGMLQYDLPGTRDLIGRYMFRCLGKENQTSREAYLEIRNCLGSVLNTPQGLILAHVLKGIELALDSQTQLFLLFDGDEYLGFCLLGEEFHVWAHGSWHGPLSADGLREQLAEIYTSQAARERLLQVLKGCATGIETAFLEALTIEDVSEPMLLVEALSKLELDFEDDADLEKRKLINKLIGKSNLPASYKAMTPENISWAIKMLTVDVAKDVEDMPIYISGEKWDEMKRTYKILASFGPKAFSFRNQKGDDIFVRDNASAQGYKFGELTSTNQEKYPLIVYNKTIWEAVKDWEYLMRHGEMRMDFTERSGSTRASHYRGAGKKTILEALADAMKNGGLGKKKEEKGKAIEKKKAVPIPENAPISDAALEALLNL